MYRVALAAALIAIACALPMSVAPATAAGSTVNVVYAGSLVNLNEKIIGPTFQTITGDTYQGQGLGSSAIAAQIKSKTLTPDVVEFADPAVNALLMGSANGNYVSWYETYARTQLVIGYDPAGKYAKQFNLARKGKLRWYKPLLQKGLRFGRTDPQLDPKGYRAFFAFALAQKLYHLKNFEKRVLGAPDNPDQIFPEEVLVARMLAGQVDAGVFYLSEVKDAGIPYVSLPAKINLGDPKYAKLYATQHWTDKLGKVHTGAPIEYTITIPSTVKNKDAAVAFVKFVLSKRAQVLSQAHGLLPLKHTIVGDMSMVPSGI